MKPRRRIVLLCGYATAGKDAVGRALERNHGFRRVAFADALKLWSIDPGYMVDGKLWQWDGHTKGPLERVNWQYMGEKERGRDEGIWIRKALDAIDKLPPDAPIVITDARYWNECETLRLGHGAAIWHVERPGVFAANDHESEHQWRRYLHWYPADATIVNDCDDPACGYARDPKGGLCERVAVTVADALARVTQGM